MTLRLKPTRFPVTDNSLGAVAYGHEMRVQVVAKGV